MSEGMERSAKDFVRVLDDARRAYYEDRWRRRTRWVFDTLVVPALVVPVGVYGFGFEVMKPPGVPALFGVIIALSLCLVRGGIVAGWVAWVLTGAVLAGDIYLHHDQISDYKHWLMLALLGYASVLVAFHFRAPPGYPVVPRRGLAFFRRLPSARRQRQSHFVDNRSVPHICMPEQKLLLELSEPKSAILQQYSLNYHKLVSADRYRAVR
jgi:hypothetical protein